MSGEGLPRPAGAALLRRLKTSDLAAFQAYHSDAELGRYQGWTPQRDAEARAFLAAMSAAPLLQPGEWCQLGIADAASDALIGDIGLCLAADGASAEIGFTLSHHWQGRGIAGAAVAAAMTLVFDTTDARQVVAITDARNHASIRLLERLGMARIASEAALFRGEACIEHRYLLNR